MDYSSPVLIESGRPIPFPSSLVYLACRPVTRTWNRSSSGFAIGVLERNTGEALMNLRRDSFAPVVGRYPLTRGTMGLDYSKGTNQFGDCRRAASRLPGNGSCKRPRDKLVPRFAKGVGKGRKGERGDRRNVTRKVFRETSGKSLVNLKVPPCLERVDNLLINLGIIKVPPVLSLWILWIQLYTREPNSRHSIKLVKSSPYLRVTLASFFLFPFLSFFLSLLYTILFTSGIRCHQSDFARTKKTGKIVIPIRYIRAGMVIQKLAVKVPIIHGKSMLYRAGKLGKSGRCGGITLDAHSARNPCTMPETGI